MKEKIKIKVCGLTDAIQIKELSDAGIDYLGCIFYPQSERYILKQRSLQEISAIKLNNKVGVFVNETLENLTKISKEAGLQVIQLHGDENLEDIKMIKKELPEIKIIKAIKIKPKDKASEIQKKIREYNAFVDYFLFDTAGVNHGGTGKKFDWRIMNELEIAKPYFLAGGIEKEDLEEIKKLKNKPFALDLNSKFEISPGYKNIDLIITFLQQIKTEQNDNII